MADGPMGAIVAITGALMVAGTALAFNRAGLSRVKLGSWSATAAFLSFVTGALLILYGLAHILAPVSVAMAVSRVFLYSAFIHTAWATLLVLPMVLFEVPMNVLFAFRPVLGVLALIIVEIFFGASWLTHMAVPVVLVCSMVILRVDWARGRRRVRALPDDERITIARRDESFVEPADVNRSLPPAFQRPYDGLHARAIALQSASYGDQSDATFNNGPTKSGASFERGAYALPVVSAGAVTVTIIESLLLFAHAITCNGAWLNGLLAVFAILHGGLVYTSLGPGSTFA